MTVYSLGIRILLQILHLVLEVFAIYLSKNEVAEKNVRMSGHVLISFSNNGFIMCARKCEALSLCNSVNFHETSLYCELLTGQNTEEETKEGWWYMKNVEWLKLKRLSIGDGTNSSCAAGSKQIKLSSGLVHCIDTYLCGTPPSIPNATVQYSGVKATYTCIRGLHVSVCPKGDEVTYCQLDSNWKSINFTCQVVETCSDIQHCKSNYTDGEYFVYPNITDRQRVKVYCHNMATTEPKEYITLYNDNRGVHNFSSLTSTAPCKWSDRAGDALSIFNKIRINTKTMTVIRNDFTFASVTFEEPKRNIPTFGQGEDCATTSTSCPKLGYFKIDTTGTGLRVDPTLSWILHGHIPQISSFNRALATIEGYCGGYCGFCYPQKPMQLNVDSRIATYDTETTIVPDF